jgi:hypothetical protein
MHPDKKAHMTYIKMVVHLGKGWNYANEN